jgi:hypothetical protein
LDMQPEHSNTASEKIPLKKKKSIFISNDSPLESEELTVAQYLAADLIWEAWERRKRSRNVIEGGIMPSLCFYEKNLRAFTQNEELQESVRQFMEQNEVKASSSKTIPNKKSTEVNLNNSTMHEYPLPMESWSHDLGKTRNQRNSNFSSAQEQEASVSYTDDRVAAVDTVSGEVSSPRDTSVFSEDRDLLAENRREG